MTTKFDLFKDAVILAEERAKITNQSTVLAEAKTGGVVQAVVRVLKALMNHKNSVFMNGHSTVANHSWSKGDLPSTARLKIGNSKGGDPANALTSEEVMKIGAPFLSKVKVRVNKNKNSLSYGDATYELEFKDQLTDEECEAIRDKFVTTKFKRPE